MFQAVALEPPQRAGAATLTTSTQRKPVPVDRSAAGIQMCLFTSSKKTVDWKGEINPLSASGIGQLPAQAAPVYRSRQSRPDFRAPW